MSDRIEFFGISPPPVSAAIIGPLAGWVRDAGTPAVRLFAVTDPVAVGTVTPAAGRKITVLTTSAVQGVTVA